MGKGSQFLLLLWKNLVLLKRAPVRTFSQIAMPLFFIVILVLLRAFVVKDEHRPSVTYSPFDVNELPPVLTNESKWKIAFAPNTSDMREIMHIAAKQLSLVRVTGFQNEDEMVKVLVSEEQNNNKPSNDALFLGGIAFNTESLNSGDIIYKIRLSSKSKKMTREQKREFGMYPSISWNTQFTFPVYQFPGPREANSSYGGPPYYFEDGFLSLQHAVDFAIIKYKANMADVNTIVTVKRFPYPDCTDDPLIIAIQTTLPFLLMLSLIFTALNIVRDIVYEKEKKLKESMKMMGLSGWLHWLACFAKYFLLLLVSMALATILFKVKYNENGRILDQSSPFVLFVFLTLYGISSIMFCFCVSVFFSKANIAAAAGGIIWFISYIPYFFVAPNYDTMSLGAKIASCLLSNVAMSLGAQLIGKYEGAGTGVQWSNLNQRLSVDDDFTLGLVWVMLVVDSIIYGLIAWYVEAVSPGDYGVPQPWYFPVLATYWCGKSKEEEISDFRSLTSDTGTAISVPQEFLEKEPVGLKAGIEIRNLRKVFNTEKGTNIAVNGVSLNMYEGQITALLGHNGAGKTTLMSMLTGLFPATSGSALVNGCSISDNIAGVRGSLGRPNILLFYAIIKNIILQIVLC